MTITLYKMPEAATYYAANTPKIVFQDGAVADTGLITYNIMIDRSNTMNPAPYLEETRKPDTGFRGMRYVIKGLFIDTRDDPDGKDDDPATKTDNFPYSPTRQGAHADIGRLAGWFKVSSDIRGKFKNGSFGIINTRAPEFDVHPRRSDGTSPSGGLKLVGLDFSEQIEYGIRTAIITLEHSGSTETIGNTDEREAPSNP